MRKSKTITKTQTINEMFCDVCESRLYNHNGHYKCEGCDKDLCRKCIVWWDTDPWTEADNGDYIDTVCKECNEKARPIIEQVKEISDEADWKIAKLIQGWERLCRENND